MRLAGRIGGVLVVAAVLACGGASSASAASTAREVAASLRSDPVFVDESQSGLLTVPQRGELRLRIVHADIGRIQIAVVAEDSANRAGGVGALANAIDQAMPGRRGSLLVTNGSNFHVVTSHAVVEPTAAAVRAAVETHSDEGLDAQLLAAVDGIAEVDPGAERDLNAPSPSAPATPSGDQFTDDVGEGVRIGVFIVAAAIALPFLIGTLVFLMALRRRRAAVRDREQIDEGDARDELVALGEDLQSLDLDVDMPNASPRGREEYERALDLYDRANRLLLKDDPSEVERYEARRSIEEGRKRLAAARDALRPDLTLAACSRWSSPQNRSSPIATVGMPVTPRSSASAVFDLSRSLMSSRWMPAATSSGSRPASLAAARTLSRSESDRLSTKDLRKAARPNSRWRPSSSATSAARSGVSDQL